MTQLNNIVALIYLFFCCLFLAKSDASDDATTMTRQLRGAAVNVMDKSSEAALATATATASVLCRMTIFDTQYKDGTNEEQLTCIPVVDDQESDAVIPLELDFVEELDQTDLIKLKQGRLFVNITNAQLAAGDIALTDSSNMTVVDNLPTHLRHLQEERKLQSTGKLTLAIVRISTKNKSPTPSKAVLEQILDESKIHIAGQFNKCSFGKFHLQKASPAVVDVKVSSSSSKGALIQDAQNQVIQDLGLQKITDLADRIIFCVPPGTGNWIGSASLNHYRVDLNNEFCLSFSAAMHEVAHTMGLLHAWKGNDERGDYTGYLGRSYEFSYWPQRCFNGVYSDMLGWYADKTMEMSSNDPPRLVRLAGVVDYDKTTQHEPVLIKIDGKAVLQYNRVKDFNGGSVESVDAVAVTEHVDGHSQFLVAIYPGRSYEYGDVLIEACKSVDSSSTGGADAMLVSVGKGASLCDQV